jgi:hypothetical protein
MDNRPKWCKQIEQRAKNMDSKMPDARQCEKRFINMLNKNPIMRKIIEPIFDIGSFIFTEVVFEVVILAFVVSLMFARFQWVINYLNDNPKVGIMKAFWIDYKGNPAVYSIFILLIVIWALIKLKKQKEDKQKTNDVLKKLDEIKKLLQGGKDDGEPEPKSNTDSHKK